MHPGRLDDIAWLALAGPHRAFALGDGAVRRYAPGFVPVAAFADRVQADGAALAALFAPGEAVLVVDVALERGRWADWRLVGRQRCAEFVLLPSCRLPTALTDRAAGDGLLRALGPGDAAAMQALIAAAGPGGGDTGPPGLAFAPRGAELGPHLGVYEGAELVALAGTRLVTEGWRETGVLYTAPAWRRRGLGTALVRALAARALEDGGLPFAHVAADSHAAQRLFRRLGFAHRRDVSRAVLVRR